MSMPSILITPDCGSKARWSKAERRRLAGAGCADQRDGLAGSAVKAEIGTGGALAVVGKRNVLELDEPAHAAGSSASGRSRTAGSVSSTSKNSLSRGASITIRLAKLHDLFEPADQQRGIAHEHDDLADRGLTVQIEPDAEHQDRRAW